MSLDRSITRRRFLGVAGTGALLVGVPAAFRQVADALHKLPKDVESLRTKLEPQFARLSARYPEQAQVIRDQVETFLKEHLVECEVHREKSLVEIERSIRVAAQTLH